MGSYEGEWIGLNNSRLSKPQRAFNKARRSAYGGRMLEKHLNGFLVMMELGIQPLNIHFSKSWMHLYYKTAELQTPLKDLSQGRRHGNLGTWLSNTRSGVKLPRIHWGWDDGSETSYHWLNISIPNPLSNLLTICLVPLQRGTMRMLKT
ncbi:hypothetical protein O181_047119 [Austropuccinia psidii MF-1]|uniref:Uncharacterized protein n=1 Tax=Austropuccinia psidii MF-1 TaxID=1389203 RepID=A0A9Q3DQE9_9BASI|nr:hypothetical protein [Austropuccinia psidii MF-1]